MQKRLFAILMTIMMMVTFMPSMAFAEKMEDPIRSKIAEAGGFDFQSVSFDDTDYTVDSTGKVLEKFKGEKAFNIELSDSGFTAGQYTLEASVKGDVALYWSDCYGNVYDMSKKSPRISYSGDQWFRSKESFWSSMYAVVKNKRWITKPFTVTFSLVKGTKKVAELAIPFNTESAGAKINDVYYYDFDIAVDSVKDGQTIKLLQNYSAKGGINMPDDKSFMIDGGYHTLGGSGAPYDLGKNITYKNLTFNSGDLAEIGDNTTLDNCVFHQIGVNVIQNSQNVVIKDSEVANINLDTSASATLVGKCTISTQQVELGKATTLDASELTLTEHEEELRFTPINDATISSVTVVLPENDERWAYDGKVYSLCGQYKYNNKTYLTWNEVSAAASDDANPAVKMVGPSGKNDVIAPKYGQKITLTGTEYSNFSGKFDLTNGGDLNIKSGIYHRQSGVTEFIKTNYPGRTKYVDENSAILGTGDKNVLIVGNDLCLNYIKVNGYSEYSSKNEIDKVKYDGAEPGGDDFYELGTLSAKSICDAVATNRKIDPKHEFYYVCVAGKAEEELLKVGKEFSIDITKYILFHNWSPVQPGKVFGVQLNGSKYAVLGEKEFYEYYYNWEAAEKLVDKNITVKSRALSTTSAQLYANKKGVEVEGAGKNGKVTGLKAGAIKTYTVKPYVSLADGKVKVYGDSQKVVVRSRAYTPSVKAGKKSVKVSFKKMSGAKKYQISVSRSKTKTKVKSSSTKRSLKIKNLKSKKTYYVKVRTVNSKGVKGAWSAVKTVKVK